jgi:hypothetical protein
MWPKREAVHSSSSISEVKNTWSCISTVLFSYSIKHREKFYLEVTDLFYFTEQQRNWKKEDTGRPKKEATQ